MDTPSPRITSRAWFVMFALALTGQIAWTVENSWFNTFVFDTITPDPRPVAWMVAVSAITATLTTLFMGTLSDLFEWQLYNAAAVGMGLDGTTYLYNNPLTCKGGVTRKYCHRQTLFLFIVENG